jgi:Skp family chaperone for outer membrane proteins
VKKLLSIAGIALLVLNTIGLNTIGLILLYAGQKKTAYIDYNTVYNNCALKLTLEKDLERVTNRRKGELDSMQLQLSFLSQDVSTGNPGSAKLYTFEQEKNKFLTIQQRYEEENIRLKEAYFTQIRKDINDKCQAFAAAKGYNYLFAAVGDGALMYGSEAEDVTKEFQEYLDKQQ